MYTFVSVMAEPVSPRSSTEDADATHGDDLESLA